jgi:hypothetical protein
VICVVCCVRFAVASFPSLYWSIRFCGMGSINGGWLLVVGFGSLCFVLWVWMSPIWGSSRMSALWSHILVCMLLWLCFDPYSMTCLLVALGANNLCVF